MTFCHSKRWSARNAEKSTCSPVLSQKIHVHLCRCIPCWKQVDFHGNCSFTGVELIFDPGVHKQYGIYVYIFIYIHIYLYFIYIWVFYIHVFIYIYISPTVTVGSFRAAPPPQKKKNKMSGIFGVKGQHCI